MVLCIFIKRKSGQISLGMQLSLHHITGKVSTSTGIILVLCKDLLSTSKKKRWCFKHLDVINQANWRRTTQSWSSIGLHCKATALKSLPLCQYSWCRWCCVARYHTTIADAPPDEICHWMACSFQRVEANV
jgi:hypothetical protein